MKLTTKHKQDLNPLSVAADYAVNYRVRARPLHPSASAEQLRARFCVPLPEEARDGAAVIGDADVLRELAATVLQRHAAVGQRLAHVRCALAHRWKHRVHAFNVLRFGAHAIS